MDYDELLNQGLIDIVMSEDNKICYVRDILRQGDYNLVQALKVIMYKHRDIIVVVRGLATSDFFYINQNIALTDKYLSLLKGLWFISECDNNLLSPQDNWSDLPGDYFNAFGRLAWMYVNAKEQFNTLFGNHNIKDLYAVKYMETRLKDKFDSFEDIIVKSIEFKQPKDITNYLSFYVEQDWVKDKPVNTSSDRSEDFTVDDSYKLDSFTR